ncbi:mechanosensitive ion channel domain-containing protein [Pigmentiphaga sp.]|uniref:mechanosensitive ion channel domain-containing protein n=1 Tax=Pigmentiphaga sp. TaxID=1977564 RepID=UPI0025DDCA14|nr:mechanosensitive ion channel domain-containing protein [Pigmentiphaga sp.]
MQTRRPSPWTALALLGLALWMPPPANAAEAPAPAVTPAEARHVLDLLRDDARRAELEQTLGVIAEAVEQQAPPQTAEPAAPEVPVALEKDGLIAQAFTQAGKWVDSALGELRLTGATLLSLRSAGAWWQYYLGTPEARAATLQGLGTILLILAAALGVEAGIGLLLRRPRARLLAYAERRHTPDTVPPSAPDPDTETPAEPDQHLRIVRRLPAALVRAVLSLVPLAGFLAVATVLMTLFGAPTAGFYPFILPLIGAYLAMRLTMTALRLLTSPSAACLRLSRLSDESARYLDTWLRRVVAVGAFGVAATEIAYLLGAGDDARNALSKLVGLAVHTMLIVMVVQRRRQVSHWIRGQEREGLRAVLANVWAPTAIVVIAGLWVVWALGTASGLSQLLHYVWRTALVMLAATVLSMILLGALDRAFYSDTPAAGDGQPGRRPYQTLAQRVVMILVFAATAIALLEVWGVHALDWFETGTVGRRLVSATATIAVSCILALAAWEAANLSINRRMERWTRAGDLARATRLRTLVPILRTTLFIVIALIVLFTALNELGINIAPLLAGASIIGVAIGFGSQKLVQDFITGIFLLMENAMQVGDSVTLAGVSGTVEYLSIRTVRLRAGDGSLHVVPFSAVGTVSNSNRGIGNASVRVSVSADSDLDEVIAAIRNVGEEMRNDPNLGPLMLADLDLWGVDQVDGASVTLAGQIRTLDRGRTAVQRGFNQRIYRRFRQLGIQFANPQASFVRRLDGDEPRTAAPRPAADGAAGA